MNLRALIQGRVFYFSKIVLGVLYWKILIEDTHFVEKYLICPSQNMLDYE